MPQKTCCGTELRDFMFQRRSRTRRTKWSLTRLPRALVKHRYIYVVPLTNSLRESNHGKVSAKVPFGPGPIGPGSHVGPAHLGTGPIWAWPHLGMGPIWAWVRFGPGPVWACVPFGPGSNLGLGPIWAQVPFFSRKIKSYAIYIYICIKSIQHYFLVAKLHIYFQDLNPYTTIFADFLIHVIPDTQKSRFSPNEKRNITLFRGLLPHGNRMKSISVTETIHVTD